MKKLSCLTFVLSALVGGGIFAAEPINLALGKPYTFNRPPNYKLCTDKGDCTQLTDGAWQQNVTGAFWTRPETVGWITGRTGARLVTVDLGKDEPIAGCAWNFAAGRAGVEWPDIIYVYVSSDNKTWRFVGDLLTQAAQEASAPNKDGYAVYRARALQMPCHGRYVAFLVQASGFIFVDELEVYKGSAANYAENENQETAANPLAHYAMRREHQNFYNDANKIGRAAQGLPSNVRAELATELYRLNACVARAKGYTAPFFWTCERWANVDILDLPPCKACMRENLSLEMMRNETRSVAVNLTNPTMAEWETTVAVEGFPKEARVEVREIVYTLVKSGARIGGLIVPNDATTQLKVRVPAGTTKQLWISFARPTAPAGRYAGVVRAGDASKAITLRLSKVTFPARPRMHVGGWDYSECGNAYYHSPTNITAKMARMREMFTDTPWATARVMPGEAKFDASGALTNADKLDFTAWNDWVTLWGEQARQYCVFMAVGTSFHGEKMGTPRFERMVSAYMQAWYAGAKARLNGRRILVLLVDEPREAEHDTRVITWAKVIKRAAPQFVIFEDVDWADPTKANPELFAVSDVICPPLPLITGMKATDFYAQKAREGKEMWLYSCSGPSRTFDPIAYYRAQPWFAWKLGAKGTFFWAFGCGGGTGNSFFPFDQPGVEYSPFFVSPTDCFRAKQSEAIMESVEDYEYLAMLADKASALAQLGSNVSALCKLLAEAPDRALPTDEWIKTNAYSFTANAARYDWNRNFDRTRMDAVRLEVLRALEQETAD